MDWLLIALWGGTVFGVVILSSAGALPEPTDPWRGQAIGLITMTAPVTLYFALCESSRMRASFGKRAAGLIVADHAGARLSFARALVRNALKFVPWELGHMVAWQAASSGDAGPPAWVWVPAVTANVVVLWWLGTMLATGTTPYDRWAGTQIRLAGAPSTPPDRS